MLDEFAKARKEVVSKSPLIHCITNPISINDCANAVLALGAKPIMAEHPKEVGDITKMAMALAVNLGNITDARIESIMKSGRVAFNNKIPSVIDLVGTACSKLRFDLAREYIISCHPAVIKGNVSEIKRMAGVKSSPVGIDVSKDDAVRKEDVVSLKTVADVVRNYAADTGSVVMASGEVDIISNGCDVWYVKNGDPLMAKVTGTGCMLNVIAATYLSVAKAETAAVLSAVTLGIAGQLADKSFGTATYRTNVIDKLSLMTDDDIAEYLNVSKE